MILNDLDLGGVHPGPSPITGQVTGSVMVEGAINITYPRGSVERKQIVSFYITAWQAIGGAAANTQAALQYLVKQVEELAGNRDLQPVFIQWSATAAGGGATNVSTSHDGWYIIDSFEPDYDNFIVGGAGVRCRMTVSFVAAAPPGSLAMSYSGGALSSNYSGASQIAIGYPAGTLNQAANGASRTGGEGALPLSVAPSSSTNPLTFTPSATIANWFQGGCRVYDTLTVGGNAVPTGGTFTHASWVEVKGTDHIFAGDCIVTNGLLLYRIQTGQTMPLYVWSTAQSTPGWLQVGTVDYLDNSNTSSLIRSYTLDRVGLEEGRVTTRWTSVGNNNYAAITLRLQRSMMFARVDFKPLSQANTTAFAVRLNPTTPKVTYNSGAITDHIVGLTSLAVQTDYGYAATFTNSTSQPFIAGWLYQNEPSANQPNTATAYTTLGDSSGPAQNATRSYGIFAVPYGTSTTTTDKLQAEAESGTLDAGWTSQANGSASGGNEAKVASGTVAGHNDKFGTAFIPAAGTYDVWFRIKVTTNVGSAAEMNIGLWDTVAAGLVASGFTTVNRTSMTTSYAWYRMAAGVTLPPSGHSIQFIAQTQLTIGTDWFIDEACLVPLTLSTANTGPQEIFSQFLHDRSVRMVRQ